jgi:hypothetical protein
MLAPLHSPLSSVGCYPGDHVGDWELWLTAAAQYVKWEEGMMSTMLTWEKIKVKL